MPVDLTSLVASFAAAIKDYNNELISKVVSLNSDTPISPVLAALIADIESNQLKEDSISKCPGLSTTQKLFLHLIYTNQRILKNIQNISKHGLYRDGIIELFIDRSSIASFSRYLIKVQQADPDSYELFKLLNNYSYSVFIRHIYTLLVTNNMTDIAEIIKNTVLARFDSKYQVTDISDKKYSVFNHIERFIANTLKAIVNYFIKTKSLLDGIISHFHTEVGPAALQVRYDIINQKNIKTAIQELLNLELTLGFRLTADFFTGFVNTCFPDSEPDYIQSRARVLRELNDYIVFARTVRDRELADNKPFKDKIENLKKTRKDLDKISVVVKDLLFAELVETSTLGPEKKEQFKRVIAGFTKKSIRELLTSLKSDADIPGEFVDLLAGFAAFYDLESNSDLLVDAVLWFKDRSGISAKAKWYIEFVELVSADIKKTDGQILDYFDSILDNADALLLIADSNTALTSSDFKTVLASDIYNPLESKLTRRMPFYIDDKLRNLNRLEESLIEIQQEITDWQSIDALQSTASDILKNKYARLKELEKLLKSEIAKFTTNILSSAVTDLVTARIKELRDKSKKLVDSHSIVFKEYDKITKDIGDQAEILFDLIKKLETALAQQTIDIAEVVRLITAIINNVEILEQQKHRKIKSFNCQKLKYNLHQLLGYYSAMPKARRDEAARVGRLARPVIYKKKYKLYLKLLALAKIFSAIHDAFFAVVRWGLGVFAEIFNVTLRFILRFRKNNRSLLRRLDKLRLAIQTEIRALENPASSPTTMAVSTEEKRVRIIELKKLLQKVKALRSQVGRFFAKPTELRAEFKKLSAEKSKPVAPPALPIPDATVVRPTLTPPVPPPPLLTPSQAQQDLLDRITQSLPRFTGVTSEVELREYIKTNCDAQFIASATPIVGSSRVPVSGRSQAVRDIFTQVLACLDQVIKSEEISVAHTVRAGLIAAMQEIAKPDIAKRLVFHRCCETQQKVLIAGAQAVVDFLKIESNPIENVQVVFLTGIKGHLDNCGVRNPVQNEILAVVNDLLSSEPAARSVDSSVVLSPVTMAYGVGGDKVVKKPASDGILGIVNRAVAVITR